MKLTLPKGITLYFCRHGETEANVQKRFQGAKDTALTKKGREQARQIGETLKAQAPEFASLAYISSPFRRACTTMEIIRTTAGLPAAGYTTDARLQEINLGSWDGFTDAEVRTEDPAFYDARMANRAEIRVPGGGENYADVAARLESWAKDLKQDTFAVSHGAATRILRGILVGRTWDEITKLDENQGDLYRARDGVLEKLPPA